ncbi:MAG: rhomboid family intramembrane serine protease [Acidobacteria bacterium]|nr:rhomboid family intramembrane serine protease [Acidobacteriota bacterium]NIM63574.1 rhomboid family intramembrane serine protease [Acidobacteriota bacterium]NIO58436.1 rhomboid family intramembrane serine protease [Acidobacteriota bacterium]NIQ29491.1 rhomboid family intramembrane serine protease [Acidobacteriota bacterium]NIQ84168.1 rhomboid family intramembrane serine protease [Acidobacteriota bacterium]
MSYYRQGPTRGGSVTIGVPPVTPMLRMIIIVNAAIFLPMQLTPVREFLLQYFALTPGQVLSGYIWQVATYMLLHAGLGHIFFNMLILWMFSGELERLWGSRAYLRYYVVCGVGGGVAIFIQGAIRGSEVPTLGASGALYGMIMAYGLLFSERRVLFMMMFPMKAKTFAMIFFFFALYYNFASESDGISHIGHLGGALTGLIYLKRAWRVDRLVKNIRWRIQRRRFKVMMGKNDDTDRWVN